jgi:hypothetical protein
MKPMIPIRPQADATSKLSRGGKGRVNDVRRWQERPISIDRLNRIRIADAVPSASGVVDGNHGNQASQVLKQPMYHHRLEVRYIKKKIKIAGGKVI